MMRLVMCIVLALQMLAWPAAAQDARYCGPPKRDALGTIVRSREVLRDFQGIYPCPANGQPVGACPGWFKDHIVPLVCGGCDSVENLQWLPGAIKTCAGTTCKDRFERRVYCRYVPPPSPVTPTPSTPTTEMETSP
jgi:hypothetical protein